MKSWKKAMVFAGVVLMIVAVFLSYYIVINTEEVITHREPFNIEYSDEIRHDEWETISEFPYEGEKSSIDLTYGTFHEYIRVSYFGDDNIDVNATFSVEGDIDSSHIGFIVFEGIVSPRDLTWNNTRAVNGVQAGEVRWGHQEKNFNLSSRETKNLTLIYVLNDDASRPMEDEVWIRWDFESSERLEYRPADIAFPRIPTDRRSPYTPFTFSIAIMVTASLGYIILKRKEVL